MQEIQSLLRQVVTYGWEASKRKELDYITKSLIAKDGFAPKFKDEPPSIEEDAFRIVVGVPIVLALKRCKRTGFVSSLEKLSESERKLLLDALDIEWEEEGLLQDPWTFLFHFAPNIRRMHSFLSHTGAAFAYTARLRPKCVSFLDVINAVEEAQFGSNAALEAIYQSWFLIVTSPLDKYAKLQKLSGDVLSFFLRRAEGGRATVFVDLLEKASFKSRDSFLSILSEKSSLPPKLHSVILGSDTYLNFHPPLLYFNSGRGRK